MEVRIKVDSLIQAQLLERILVSGITQTESRSSAAYGGSATILEPRIREAFRTLAPDPVLTNALK